MKKSNEFGLIGAHFSAAGGVSNALYQAKTIEATTAQLFTSNQRQWKSRPYTPDIISNWDKALQETGLQKIMSHDSYLINLGSPNEEALTKSRLAFAEEIDRCLQLKIDYLNFHPGSHLNSSVESCLDRIVESLKAMRPLLEKSKLRLLLETTAGQGTNVGHRFEHLAYLLSSLHQEISIGVCIDTCHIFVAGYDIRTRDGWNHTLEEFDRIIGLSHLHAFHLNDSLKGLSSRVDRHADLGKGQIGWESFHFLMTDSRTKHLPKYLETPGMMQVWDKEIKELKRLGSED